jgi:regulator of sigma E protease
MNLLFTLVSFAVTLGVLIVVHELGHYFVAKWCGVKVLRFSIGFGKPLFTRRRGPDQTEWVLAAFPLGGYVKMLDEGEGAVAPHELARAFNRQPVAKRIAVVMAGPFANLILAVALYCLLFMAGVPGVKPMLGNVPKGTAAAMAGLSSGEVLAAIEGEPVATWQDARWEIGAAGNRQRPGLPKPLFTGFERIDGKRFRRRFSGQAWPGGLQTADQAGYWPIESEWASGSGWTRGGRCHPFGQ